MSFADHFSSVAARYAAFRPRYPAALVEALAERADTAGVVFALVVAAQAAHWFDWPRFLAEALRVAVPGALVALVSYGNLVADGAAGAEIARFHRDVAGPHWPPGRQHVENGYRDLVMPWPAVPAPPLEMTADWTRDEVVGYVSSWSATARLVELEGPGPFDAFCEALAAAWPGGERRRVRWPLLFRLARL
jgi:hypothetical protein